MDTGSRIHDWLGSAQYDLDSAITLLDEYRLGHALALCRECLDKVFKACWVSRFKTHPPPNASLMYLASRLEFHLHEPQIDLLATLSLFDLRSEDVGHFKIFRRSIDKEFAERYLMLTESFIEWIKPILRR